MSNITKFAKGLSSLLGLRDNGRTIGVLAEQLAGVVDLTELYLLDTRVRVGTWTYSPAAVGYATFTATSSEPFVVPAGELWYVHAFVATATLGAGDAVNGSVACILDGNPLGAPVGPNNAGVATENPRWRSDRPFWAGPGTEFGFGVQSFTGAPTINAAAVVTRLRV